GAPGTPGEGSALLRRGGEGARRPRGGQTDHLPAALETRGRDRRELGRDDVDRQTLRLAELRLPDESLMAGRRQGPAHRAEVADHPGGSFEPAPARQVVHEQRVELE